jgi:hypothetical protein
MLQAVTLQYENKKRIHQKKNLEFRSTTFKHRDFRYRYRIGRTGISSNHEQSN